MRPDASKGVVFPMAKYECMQCGWVGKPMVMEPATKACPKCGSVKLRKLKNE